MGYFKVNSLGSRRIIVEKEREGGGHGSSFSSAPLSCSRFPQPLPLRLLRRLQGKALGTGLNPPGCDSICPIVSNIGATGVNIIYPTNCQNKAQMGLLGHEAKLHIYSLEL